MAAVQQRQGVGTLAYPFYLVESNRDAKPVPTEPDATLFVLATRETFVWNAGAWVLYGTPATDPALLALLSAVLLAGQQVLRELRLTRQGQIRASTCAEYDGPPEELDDPQ